MVSYSFSLKTLEYFLAVFARVTGFVTTMPVYGMQNVPPNRIKVGFALGLSVILFQALPRQTLEYRDVIGFAAIIAKETVTGLMLGFMANICLYSITLAGQFIDQHVGLGMAQEFNPALNINSGVTGNMYYYSLLMILLGMGLDHYLIRAFADTYQLVPVNGQVFRVEQIIASIITFMSDLFILAFRISLPIFSCIMIMNVILGIMAKVAPQMNMFSVGMQLKVLSGYAVLFLSVRILPAMAEMIFKEIRRMTVAIVQALY